jgi:hypothetical protein
MSAVIDFPAKPEARPYLDAFDRRPGEPEWLASLRERSLARFAETGFPSRRSEAWRYIDLRPLADGPMLPAAVDRGASARVTTLLSEIGLSGIAARLVLVDGRFVGDGGAARRIATLSDGGGDCGTPRSCPGVAGSRRSAL